MIDVAELPLMPLYKPKPGQKIGPPMWDEPYKNARPLDEELEALRAKGHMLGVATDNLLVLDLDIREGVSGIEALAELEKQHGALPRTRIVGTPSKGQHLYFEPAYPVASSVNKLGQGIDVRGHHGFVVAAGSKRPDGEYTVLVDAPIAAAPEWLIGLCGSPRARDAKEHDPLVELDKPVNIARAIAHLMTREPAVEGTGGDRHTFIVCCEVIDFGISRDMAFEIMEEWNNNCSPAWMPKDLQRKILNAWNYRTSAPGRSDPTGEFEAVVPEPSGLEPRPIDPRLIAGEPLDRWRFWLLGNLAIRTHLTLLVAPPGVGKSTFTITAALSVATGRELVGLKTHEPPQATWLYNNEDNHKELTGRLAAQLIHHDIDPRDIADRFFMNSGAERRLVIAKRRGPERKLVRSEDIPEIERYIRAKNIALMIIDPFSETHEGDENDNIEMRGVAILLREVAQRCNMSIVLVHHTRKLPASGSDGHAGNQDSGRGASSVNGVARAIFTLYDMSSSDAKEFGVLDAQRGSYARLDAANPNLAPRGSRPSWLRRDGIDVPLSDGGSENVGVLVAVQLVEVAEDEPLAMTEFDELVTRLCEGGPRVQADLIRDMQSQMTGEGSSRQAIGNRLGRKSMFWERFSEGNKLWVRSIKSVKEEAEIDMSGLLG